MKYLLLICFVILSRLTLQAQNKKIDSVNNLIAKAATDTARINLLNAKATIYAENSLDSAINIASANSIKAKQLHYLKGEADANRIKGTALTQKGSFALAKQNLTMAEQLYQQTADSDGLNKVYRGYGMYYGRQSKYDSSIIFFRKNVEYDERNDRKKDLTSAYQNIAVSLTMSSQYQQALLYQGKALKLAESLNDVSTLAYINLNMGIGYSNVSDYPKSEELYLKAIKYARQANIKNVELYAYANLASTCSQLNRYGDMYDYAMKAAALGKQLGDYDIIASSLSRAGSALTSQKRYGEAEKLNLKAIAIADTAGSPLSIYQTYSDMGYLRREQQRYPEAVQFYEKGFAALKDADIYDSQIGDSYNGLSAAYEQTGAYQKALNAYKTSVKIIDSIRSRENIRKATEMSMTYDFDKKQQTEKAEQDKKNATADARQLALMIGLGCTLLLIIGAAVAYRNKQRANHLLQTQKAALEQTLAELKVTQAQLIQSEKMASLGELTAGIAHEIQNPLNFVNNFSEVSIELADELYDEIRTIESLFKDRANIHSIIADLIQNQQKISHHGKRADAIVKGMLQHSRISTGQKEPADINTLADEYLRLSYHGLRAKDKSFNASIKTNFDDQIGAVNIIPQDIGRVFLNLFTNAFYAVTQKKKALLSAGKEDAYEPLVTVTTKKLHAPSRAVEIMISDNGSGIPQQVIDKIFQPFFTTKPTGQGTGLGLSLSYDIIKAHGGTIKAETNHDGKPENEGARFIITLPV